MRPGRGDRRAGAAAGMAAALSLFAAAAGAADAPGTVIQDPSYGEVLFHFYQRDDFTALTHLLAARAEGRVSHHDMEAELLLGGLYLAYGQHREAGQIFARLLDRAPTAAVRDRAWFYLGKVRYQRGLYPEAVTAFQQVGEELPDGLAAERRLLLAQSYMALAQYDDAARVLAAARAPDDWQAYGQYNLGVALVRLGRLDEGAGVLDQVGSLAVRAPELQGLRDKANLALGYAYLQAERPADAKTVLQRVRLRGPFSNKALLGVGWADALQANYRAALTPWLALRDRDLLDGAVQESLLAVPYAFGKLDAHGSAVDRYLEALDAFDAEMGRLDGAITRARDGRLVPALLREDDPDIGRWYWQLKDLQDSDDTRYLYHLVANHEFQDGLRNYRDLQFLAGHLDEWRDKLAAFNDMIDTRQQAYEQRLPAIEARLATVDFDGLRARRDAAAARLEHIEATRDVAGLASPEQAAAWERLQALEGSAAWQAPAAASARDKHRLLQGLLLWDLDRDYQYRLWQERRELAALDTAVARAEDSLAQLRAARDRVPAELAAYRARLAALAPRLDGMQAQVAAVLGDQQGDLQRLAVRELEAQKDRLATYRVQARFALATIYDRANATASRAGEAP